jgi:hypothetical protein
MWGIGGSYHDEGVVQDEHDCREPKGPAVVVEDHLAEIADIADLRMAQTKFPRVSSSDAVVSQVACARTYQQMSEVYRTNAAMTAVRIRPGTRPRMEYDQGNDMMARQMYSENSSAAVYIG